MLNVMRSLRQKLAKTKSGFLGKIAEAIKLRGKVDDELLEEIEDILLRSDTGVEMTQIILDRLREIIRYEQISDSDLVMESLQNIMKEILTSNHVETASLFDETGNKPKVIVFVGVNGVGKTTSIGKIANRFRNEGKSVIIIAGDTWRAAAIEQLTIWAERSGASIIKSQQGADPSAIIYDGISSAIAKDIDIVLIDTAGRQHTKENLMKELEKIDKTIKKLIPDAPHEALLVIDATTGQNAVSQATHFNNAMKLSGLILSKFDGTAKGGIIFNLKHNLELPVKLVGVGETINDLMEFKIDSFMEAFFSNSNEEQD